MTKLLALLALTLLAPLVHANDVAWFTAVKLSLGQATMSDISHGGSIGTGLPIDGYIDGRLREDETDDYTAGLGFAVGRRVGNWTVEGEYVYRYRTDWDIAAPTPSIATVTNVFTDVTTHTLIFNLIRRGVINQDWSWEVGAGIGVVMNKGDTEYLERATPTTPELRFEDTNRDNDFTYNVLAGVTRDLGGPWTLNIRYRYIDLGDLGTGPFLNRPARLSAEHHSHEVQFSVEFEL